jgi:hypothetical protein
MNAETLIALFAILLTISLGAERLLETFKPLFDKINAAWQGSIKLACAIVIGFGLAALFRFDVLARLTIVGVPPVLSYILAGLIASTGSTTINRILEWLKTLRSDTTVTATRTTKTSEGSTVMVAEVKSESSRTPVTDTVQAAADAVEPTP